MNQIKNLLLVEDDLDDQLFFTDAISEIKNALLLGIANNGQEALDTLEHVVILPDIIFMDINMPVMNGMECLIKINQKPQIKNIPVVILSTSAEQAEIFHKLGAKAFIKKPSDCQTLRQKLELMINLDFITDSQIANQTFTMSEMA